MSLLMKSLSQSFECLPGGSRCKMLFILKVLWTIYLISLRITSDVSESYLEK